MNSIKTYLILFLALAFASPAMATDPAYLTEMQTVGTDLTAHINTIWGIVFPIAGLVLVGFAGWKLFRRGVKTV